MMLFDNVSVLLLALAIDAIIGDPNWVYRRIPHPVAIIGNMIGKLDLLLNKPDLKSLTRKLLGVLFLIICLSYISPKNFI